MNNVFYHRGYWHTLEKENTEAYREVFWHCLSHDDTCYIVETGEPSYVTFKEKEPCTLRLMGYRSYSRGCELLEDTTVDYVKQVFSNRKIISNAVLFHDD